MASAQKLMHDFTGATERAAKRNELPKIDNVSPADDALKKQAHFDWLQSTVTKEVFKLLKDEADDLINVAISLSVAYPTTQNHLQIVNNLVRVNQIRNTLNKYAEVR